MEQRGGPLAAPAEEMFEAKAVGWERGEGDTGPAMGNRPSGVCLGKWYPNAGCGAYPLRVLSSLQGEVQRVPGCSNYAS